MSRHFEIDAERGEMMAEKIVQLARDAQSFGSATVHLQQLRRHTQFRIRLGERDARAIFLDGDANAEEREELEAEVAENDGQRSCGFVE